MELPEKKEKIPAGFYGYGVRALDALMAHPDFIVKHFWAPESRLCRDVYEAEKRYEGLFKLEIIRDKADLLKHVMDVEDAACFVMNASPIILDEPILRRMDFYNIHPGSLVSNRGHHPHLWSILLDEEETEINLHSVTPEIDLGKVIECVKVPVMADDTSLTLLNRAEDQIPVLLTSLAAFLRKERAARGVVSGGVYRRKVTYEDYRLNLEKDTIKDMDRKIRARAMHHGGFLAWEEKRLYVDGIISCKGMDPNTSPRLEKGDSKGRDRPEIQVRDHTVYLTRGTQYVQFRLRRVTDLKGMILWEREEREEQPSYYS